MWNQTKLPFSYHDYFFKKTTPTLTKTVSLISIEPSISFQSIQAAALTAYVETGTSKHMPPAAVAHQVVAWLLTRAAQVAQRDAEDAGTEHAVGVAGNPSAVQRPVERAGVQAVVRSDRTRGGQAGADPKGRILRMHAGHRWRTRGQKSVRKAH